MVWRDTPVRFGTVSRMLHWTMVLLFVWQFGGMLLKDILGRGPVSAFWVGTHSSVGTLLLVLLMIRAIWALASLRRRPGYHNGFLGLAAILGHLALYSLMLIVPALALMRAFGSGKGVRLFGVQVQQPTGNAVEWMVEPAKLLHGNLAWLLLAMIVGHVAMVFVHRYVLKDDVLPRMLGRAAN